MKKDDSFGYEHHSQRCWAKGDCFAWKVIVRGASLGVVLSFHPRTTCRGEDDPRRRLGLADPEAGWTITSCQAVPIYRRLKLEDSPGGTCSFYPRQVKSLLFLASPPSPSLPTSLTWKNHRQFGECGRDRRIGWQIKEVTISAAPYPFPLWSKTELEGRRE